MVTARRWEVCRRVARQEGASRRRRQETQCWALGALRARVYLVLRGCRWPGGSVLSLPELNWRYAIRRRVGGNAGVLPWNVLLCAVVYFVVRKRSVGAPDECMNVSPCEVWLLG